MTEEEKIYTSLKKLSNKKSEAEFEAQVSPAVLEEYVAAALAEAASDFTMPGFRKGKVPHEVVREHLDEMELLEHAANEALRDAVREIAQDEKLPVLGRPHITLTKLAPKNPLGFRVRYALFPEITLPDYRKIGREIAERKDAFEATDAEIDAAILRIRRMLAPQEAPAGTEVLGDAVAPGEAAGAGDAAAHAVSATSPLPSLTDEDVKKFGPFKSVGEFREELKRELLNEKETESRDAKRKEMVREIVKHARLTVPAMLADEEFENYLAERDERLAEAGLPLEEYLKQMKKTSEELEKDERARLEEELRTSFVMQEVRKREGIEADEKEVQIGIMRLKMSYPKQPEASLRQAAEAIALQEKLFAVLEGTDREQ